MIELTFINISGIIITGLAVGFLSGLFGIGGGFLMTPILRIVFNVPYYIAVGSDLTAIAFTSFFGILKHLSLKHINFKLGIIILAGIFPGVEIGARILNFLKISSQITINGKEILLIDCILNLCFIVLLLLAAVIMFKEYLKWSKTSKKSIDLSKYKINYCYFKKNSHDNPDLLSIIELLACGFVIGILQGLLGIGGGFILVPILINYFCIPSSIVVGTSLFIICPSSVFGSISHILKGNVNFILVMLILSGSLIGSYFGAQLTEKIRGKKIRLYFIYLLVLAVIMVLIKFLSQIGF